MQITETTEKIEVTTTIEKPRIVVTLDPDEAEFLSAILGPRNLAMNGSHGTFALRLYNRLYDFSDKHGAFDTPAAHLQRGFERMLMHDAHTARAPSLMTYEGRENFEEEWRKTEGE